MLERLLLIRACRRIKGRAAGVSVGKGSMPCRILDAGWLGLSVLDVEGNTLLVPWSRIDFIEHGPACEEDLENRNQALEYAKARFAELRVSIERGAKGRNSGAPGLSPEEIEAILRQFDGAAQ